MSQPANPNSDPSSIGSTCSKKHLIRGIPDAIRQELCCYLDERSAWQELSMLMSLPESDMRTIRHKQSRNQSPSEEMLNIWGNIHGHYTDELFFLLYKLKLHPAMQMLKKFVTYNLHVLLPPIVSRPTRSECFSAQPEHAKSEKLLNCSTITSESQETRDNNCTISSNTFASNQARAQRQTNHTESTLLSERTAKEYVSSNLEINFEELIEATENWHEKNILGKGGFGTVYKGFWKQTDVAIKQIHYRDNIKVQIQQSLNELKYLGSFRHENVLQLCGYSIHGEKPCLVYEYMRGGCLDKKLHKDFIEPLTLTERLEISLGTARGINYIHTHTPDRPLIHGDIKPANVLLDKHLTPKIGDFGLAREGPNGVKIAVEVQQVFGTKCYLPPEFLNSRQLSTQVDTFSFGVTLLEIFTGQFAYSKKRPIQLLTEHVVNFFNYPEHKLIDLLDPNIKIQTAQDMQTCSIIFALALNCTAKNPQQRPAMEEALQTIRRFCSTS